MVNRRVSRGGEESGKAEDWLGDVRRVCLFLQGISREFGMREDCAPFPIVSG
jgi:hypothetical protein